VSAPAKKLTLAGLAAAILAAFSQSDNIISAMEMHFGTSPYLFVLASYRYELMSILIVALIVYYLVSVDFLATYSRLRLNWMTRSTALGQLHPEEWALLGVILILGTSLLANSYFKVTRIYDAYGLHYVADKLCRGDFDDAITRMRVLKANPLWEKYRSQLQAAIERGADVKELVDRRLANFEADRERGSPEELLAQAMELKVIFGSNAWRTMDPRRDPPATAQWRQFLAQMKC
jgi:hypothetical protein